MKRLAVLRAGVLIAAAVVPVKGEEVKVVLSRQEILRTPVTVQDRDVPLGQLLEGLSSPRVTLRPDDHLAPISGYAMTARCRNLPLWQGLEGIARLYSTRLDRWYWTRSDLGGRPVYTLHASRSADAGDVQSEASMEEFLLAQRRRLQAFYGLAPDRRAAAAAANPMLKSHDRPDSEALFWIHGHLPEDRIRKVIRGESLGIPTDSLSDVQRQVISSRYDITPAARGTPATPDQVDELKLMSVNIGGVRSVVLKVGSQARGVLGGIWLREAMVEAESRMWVASDEGRRPDSRPVPVPDAPSPLDLGIHTSHADTGFRLAGAAGINLLVDAPTAGRLSATGELRGPLSAVLDSLQQVRLVWKQRAPLFYLHRLGITPEDRLRCTPWPVLKELRASAERTKGFLTPEDWLRMAGLSDRQLGRLAEEFPDARLISGPQKLLLVVAARATQAERDAMARPQGASWEDWTPATRQFLVAALGAGPARELSALLRWDRGSRPPTVTRRLAKREELGAARPISFTPRVVDPAKRGVSPR